MWIIVIGGVCILSLYIFLFIKLKFEKGLQVAAIVATSIATIVIAVTAWQQMKEVNRLRTIEKSTNFGKLRNTIWEILDQCPSSGVDHLGILTREKKIEWMRKTRRLLDSEIDNPLLIENETCLGYWRNAISSAKISSSLLEGSEETYGDERFIIAAKSILGDVMFVWEKLILESDEVSATGGRPEEE